MLLTRLQHQLSALYETPVEHCIMDFLVTDARLAASLAADEGSRSESIRILFLDGEEAVLPWWQDPDNRYGSRQVEKTLSV